MKAVDIVQLGSVVVCAAGLALPGCGSGGISGIETTNGDGSVSASANRIQGTAPSFSRIYLSTDTYTPVAGEGTARSTAADADGEFGFDSLAPDTYTLVVSSPDSRFGAVVKNIVVSETAGDSSRAFSLIASGTITGTVESTQGDSTPVLVYLPGTALYTVVPSSGAFSLSPVPPGEYSIQASALSPSSDLQTPQVLSSSNRTSVTVRAGRTAGAGNLRIP